MAKRWHAVVGVIFLVALCAVAPALAPPAGAEARTVNVAVTPLTPFVIKASDRWTGFTIELWEEIAERLGWSTKYLQVDGIQGQLKAVTEGRADVAASGLSITSARERSFDFSQPIVDGGMQIMVPDDKRDDSTPGLRSFLGLLASKSMLVWLSAAAIVALVPAHIMWLTERRHANSMVSRSYFPGIFQSFAWGFGALAAVPPGEPNHWVGRTLAVLWGYVGIIFVALYTANLTANLTVEQIEGRINGPDDLYGKSVATVAGTTTADYLNSIGVGYTAMPTIDDCYRALEEGYDAVVFDSPVLRYYVTHQGAGKASIAGPVFHDEDYGLLYRLHSDLRKPVDGALLAIREDGTYDTIATKWFGPDEQVSSSGG